MTVAAAVAEEKVALIEGLAVMMLADIRVVKDMCEV